MLDLTTIILLLAIVFNILIGSFILLNNFKNSINISYFFLSTSTSLWIFTNYIIDFINTWNWAWFWSSLSYTSGIIMAFSFFIFCYLFPKKIFFLSIKIKSVLLILFLIGLIISFIPKLTIKDIIINPWQIITGSGVYFIFALVFILPFIAFIISFEKLKSNLLTNKQKIQIKFLIGGIFISSFFALLLNIYLPLFHDNYNFIKIGPAFSFFMISLTAYSILRHNLFNIKIIATELFIFSLWIVILIRTIISENLTDFTVNGILLISTIILGIFLIRSVIKEVSQREHIENLARNLSRTNTKLEIANERLKELDRQKTEFVSMASHQLRTPLTAIRGYTSMLLEGSFGKLTKKQQEAAQVVMDSGQRLSNIIEDFLTLTRMELGKMKYEITEFDLKQTVEDLIKEMKPGIEQKGLKIKSSAGRGQFNFKGDYGKISQVLSNLIDNASKYTQEGEISIRLDKENDKFKITVADTGVGMDQKTINNLFQKFVRADGAGKINYVGTGLGLFVARQIVESHQGKIWAESDGPKQGSRFIVELPDVAEMENTKNLEDFAENL